jgi:hypothetical protein
MLISRISASYGVILAGPMPVLSAPALNQPLYCRTHILDCRMCGNSSEQASRARLQPLM